jgi:hypothetical protein
MNKIKAQFFTVPATNQGVGSSNLSGRATKSNSYALTALHHRLIERRVSTIFCFKGVAVYLEALNGPPCFPARVSRKSSGAFKGLLSITGLRADCAGRIDLDQDFCEIPHRNPDVVRGLHELCLRLSAHAELR